MGLSSDPQALGLVAIMLVLALAGIVLTIARPFRWPPQ